MDIAETLVIWRRRPASVAGVGLAVVATTGLLVQAGGPPSPVTHLYYLAVIAAAILWGPVWGVAVGGICGALAEPGTRALLSGPSGVDDVWILRAGALMLVGWVCGSLTRSLLARVEELATLNRQTIFAFVRAIDARDPYTARHSEKVASYAIRLARACGLPAADCERIHLAGLLHDIGKVGLERSVLHKPDKLSGEEWAQVRQHPVLSGHIIGGVSRFSAFLPGVREHHERFDGGGYPDGVAGDAISLDARVLAIADSFEAMTSDRSYRAAMRPEEAIARIQAGAGTQFDPDLVAVFVALELDPTAIDDIVVPLLDLGADDPWRTAAGPAEPPAPADSRSVDLAHERV